MAGNSPSRIAQSAAMDARRAMHEFHAAVHIDKLGQFQATMAPVLVRDFLQRLARGNPDRYGHLAGHEALRVVGELLKRKARVGDFYCRYGGEKFLPVLPGMTEAALYAAKAAGRNRVRRC